MEALDWRIPVTSDSRIQGTKQKLVSKQTIKQKRLSTMHMPIICTLEEAEAKVSLV